MGKELLFSITKKDFKIQTFRGSGPGGMHKNKTDSGVRIIHKASGAVAECCEQRKQGQNKKTAFNRLIETNKFKLWINRRFWEITNGETLEQKVDRVMKPKNLIIEYIGD